MTVSLPIDRGITLAMTELDGTPKAAASNYPAPVSTLEAPTVTIPLSDSRTGQATVSMYERIAAAITPGDTACKVFYKNPRGTVMLLLNGIVVAPTFDFDAGTIAFTLHDPTIRLKHRYLGYDHLAIMLSLGIPVSDGGVDAYTGGVFNGQQTLYGIPLDGRGLRCILFDAAHGTVPRAGPAPFGIRPGLDEATPQPVYQSNGVPPPGIGGLRTDGVTAGTPFTATATAGSDTLTAVDFTGATIPDGTAHGSRTPTITDAKQYARIDGPAGVLPEFASIVSAAGTSIVMSKPALENAVGAHFVTEDAIYCQLSRGDECYADITDMVHAAGAFECDWIPVDHEHTGISGDAWTAGDMCELYTADRIGTDRTQGNPDGNVPVVFVHGEGGFHLVAAPDADQMVTYVVEVGPGGPADPNDFFNKSVQIDGDAAAQYGYWEDWVQATSAGTGDTPISNALLANRGDAVLTAYRKPPQFLSAKIDSDRLGPYCYGDDFWLGDTVTVYAKKGHVELKLDARITSIGVTQTDENGNCQLDLTLVPHLTTSIGIDPSTL